MTMETSTKATDNTGKRPWSTPECRELHFSEVSGKTTPASEFEQGGSRNAT
jgi:hypothetical protein